MQILEELCYALTDLGYRTAFPIGTILANPDGKIDWETGAFFSPPQIFPMGPLTAKDYRKLILDEFPEVTDLWVEAAGPADGRDGGLHVWLALDPDLHEDSKEAVCKSVKRRLGEWRNLGDYFAEVRLAPEVPYWLHGEIKPAPGKDLASVTADLVLAVRRATAARPPAYPLEAGRAANRSLSEILTGPLLEHGEMRDADSGGTKKLGEGAGIGHGRAARLRGRPGDGDIEAWACGNARPSFGLCLPHPGKGLEKGAETGQCAGETGESGGGTHRPSHPGRRLVDAEN